MPTIFRRIPTSLDENGDQSSIFDGHEEAIMADGDSDI